MGYREHREQELKAQLESAYAQIPPEESKHCQARTYEFERYWRDPPLQPGPWLMGAGALLFWVGHTGFVARYMDSAVWWALAAGGTLASIA